MTTRRYLVAAILAETGLAWLLRFVQDDAFISFRYAANLVAGHGLVWNVGEPLEGYTNFLWTLLMAIPIRLGLDPIGFSYGIGLVLFLLTLVAVHRLALRVTASEHIALAVVIATGCNYTFAAYATGGLETCLQTLLLVSALLSADSAVSNGRARLPAIVGFSVAVSLALLTRLDSVLLLAGPFIWVAHSIHALRGAPAKRLEAFSCLVGVPTLLVGSWLAWKVSFYGDVLPNSFYVKVGHGETFLRGIYYVVMFLVTYLLVPFPIIWALSAKRFRDLLGLRWALLIVAPLTIWTLYIVAIGGDFMEFRLIVPIFPLFALLAVFFAWQWRDGIWRILLLALFPIGSLFHAVAFDRIGLLSRGVETIPGLVRHLDGPEQNWSGIGKYLGDRLGNSDVVVAVSAAGAIPYYSGLRAIDMLGPNDRWVARHGLVVEKLPGHRRLATIEYLRSRGVNLIIGHPTVVTTMPVDARDASERLSLVYGYHAIPDPGSLPSDTTVLAIPFAPHQLLLGLVLKRSVALDNAIRANGWTEWPLDFATIAGSTHAAVDCRFSIEAAGRVVVDELDAVLPAGPVSKR